MCREFIDRFHCSYRLPIEYEDGERVNETVKVVTLTGGELLVESYITYSNVTETGEEKDRRTDGQTDRRTYRLTKGRVD
jgi:hypothetical protein